VSQNRIHNSFGARALLGDGLHYYKLSHLEKTGIAKDLSRFPFSVKVLLEALLRTCDGFEVTEDDVKNMANWNAKNPGAVELPFKPARVILQDFTGVPVLVDIAAMRAAVNRLGGDPKSINPLVPVDLVIDHSVQVDTFGTPESEGQNVAIEFSRNKERYEFLRWGQNAVKNFRAVPPATGIVHQVNLEFLASAVMKVTDKDGATVAIPDSLVGTDSHTTMINGLGVVGWGVGGIEAEAVMLGQALSLLAPQVIGFKLSGRLQEGVTATDLVLTVTQMLREKDVVDKFVEFYGPGLSAMSLEDRATIANMAPEYGATVGFFPWDAEAISFLRRTGRSEEQVRLVEQYAKAQGMFRTDDTPDPEFTDTLSLELGDVEPSLAGPKRPQDRVALKNMKSTYRKAITAPVKDLGFGLPETEINRKVKRTIRGKEVEIGNGSVVIAAITSCTNTSNPSVLIAAGLLARNAVAKGLQVPSFVKTSFGPGSRVVTEYLRTSGLMSSLDALGFNVVGYGCTSCIGNSGPLPEEVSKVIKEEKLLAAAVISGNRNFEGRVHPLVKANYLASPPLVVAYALAGNVNIDLVTEPLGHGSDGKPVYLKDIWPTQEEIVQTIQRSITPAMFERSYSKAFEGTSEWKAISGSTGDLYSFQADSTYVQEPPFFSGFGMTPDPIKSISGAKVLAMFGKSVTTDHISPAGDIEEQSPAGKYLKDNGVTKADFNSYGARRGNDRVMVRGTFANIRLKNLMVPGVEGNVTVHVPSGEQMSIYDASERYKATNTPLVIFAGKEYGTGSSRDWAAKGTLLLGVRAVISESFERIHRSNLVGMGVMPLVFQNKQTIESLGLTGKETIDIEGLSDEIKPRQTLTVKATREDGSSFTFPVTARLDTPVDVVYYQNGGILQTVLRGLLKK
jgi:aconitate hydratase